MAKAIYYDANLKGKVFDVLKENEDGTVNIGTGETVVVKNCKLVDDPKHGHAILCAAPRVQKTEDGGQKPEEPKAEKSKPEGRANRAE